VNQRLIETLRSEPAAEEIDRLVSGGLIDRDLLAVITDLRSRHDPAVASAIAETAALRIRAREKFPDPDHMLFDRPGLEQATAYPVALHRLERLSDIHRIVDLGCGLGGDALAFTRLGPVMGIDVDPDRLRLAAHNCQVAGGPHRFHPILADALTVAQMPASIVFADPARRTGGRRLRGLDSYLPPVAAVIERWASWAEIMAIKVAPGIEEHEVPDGASVEWVSLDGRLREAVIWLGGPDDPGVRRATLLPSGATITGPEPEHIPVTEIGRYLHEPDDAVVRAGLVRRVAAEIGATMIDPDIAYLTSDEVSEHPTVTSHRIDQVMPFNLKRLRSRLAELDIGVVTIKKRGSPITPEELRPRLRLRGSRTATLFLTRTPDGPLAAIGLD
jgi:hypothetical protein